MSRSQEGGANLDQKLGDLCHRFAEYIFANEDLTASKQTVRVGASAPEFAVRLDHDLFDVQDAIVVIGLTFGSCRLAQGNVEELVALFDVGVTSDGFG